MPCFSMKLRFHSLFSSTKIDAKHILTFLLDCNTINLMLKYVIRLFQVAAISGDARRALEICRRAAEIADYHNKNQISTVNSSTGK